MAKEEYTLWHMGDRKGKKNTPYVLWGIQKAIREIYPLSYEGKGMGRGNTEKRISLCPIGD